MREDAGTWTVAGVILIVKAVLGGWAAVVVLAASRQHHRSFLNATITRRHGGLGLVLVVMTAATIVVAVGLLRRLSWARVAAYILEGVAIVTAVSRLGSSPGLAVLSMALSVAVIALVAVGAPRRLPVSG